MPPLTTLQSRFNSVFNNPLHSLYFYSTIILIAYLINQLIMPIRMGDTDMWYHLNAGRYFWEHFAIPDSTFFSFIDPERTWSNYYWGFQAAIYKIYDIGGYQGLIVFRALLTTGTVFLLFLILKNTVTASQVNTFNSINAAFFIILFGLIIVLYDYRSYQVRPHLVSYFFLSLYIYILQFKPKKAFLLPILTLVWANTHGIEWPAAALVCGAYTLTFLTRLFRNRPYFSKSDSIFLLSVLLCLPALLLNPYGPDLLWAPFNVSDSTFSYTAELRQLTLSQVTFFVIEGFKIHYQTALSVLFIGALILFASGLYRKTLPVSHLVLYIGALILLSKGIRFIWEWLLLSLPLLSLLLIQIRTKPGIKLNQTSKHLAVIMFLGLLLSTLIKPEYLEHPYPFDSRKLPTGTAHFLQKINKSGSVMVHPNYAGYFEWVLNGKYLTFIDMQFPPFTPFEALQIGTAYTSTHNFSVFINKHAPDWVLLDADKEKSGDLPKHLVEYSAVFTDDHLVLYVKNKTFPDITGPYAIVDINPFSLDSIHDTDKKSKISALEKINTTFPFSRRINRELAIAHLDIDNPKAALTYALQGLKLDLTSADSHNISGLIYSNLGNPQQAIAHFENALRYANQKFKKEILKNLADAYFDQNDFYNAYNNYADGLNPYTKAYTPADLFKFALSSTAVGDLKKARELIEIILYLSSSGESMHTQANKLKNDIQSGKYTDTSWF